MSSAIVAVVGKSILDKRSADKAQHAYDAATGEQRKLTAEEKAQERADFAPYRQAGGRALTRLEALMSGDYDVSKTAGYQFRLDEGYKGLDRSQAGRRLGGRAVKEAMRYGQDYASSEYGKEYDRQRSLVDVGLSAAAKTSEFGARSTENQLSIEKDYGDFRVGQIEDRGKSEVELLKNAWTVYNT